VDGERKENLYLIYRHSSPVERENRESVEIAAAVLVERREEEDGRHLCRSLFSCSKL